MPGSNVGSFVTALFAEVHTNIIFHSFKIALRWLISVFHGFVSQFRQLLFPNWLCGLVCLHTTKPITWSTHPPIFHGS
ncbi:Uncharacterized protein APZ42_027489 [Daphnia magna]|uniref:Uncharacterized protein n=1 Tax=Daphnia magna TaxID=35525 RepID=A0A164RN28_9CRUS|nr:Uncharacterized protein APZ42_027489 [Daphnia magna]